MAKKRSNRTLLIIGGILGALLLFVIVGRSAGFIGKKEGLEVELVKAKTAEIVEKVSASGKIQPEVEVKISPDVSGEIVALYVKEGDSVRKGQLLLQIRPENYESLVDRANAAVNTSRANLAQSSARVSQAEAQLVRSKAEYNRNKQLYDQKVISEADFETIQANYNVAQQEVAAARQNLQAARFNVQSSQASLREATENLQRTRIYAPVSGTISKLAVEKGERVLGTLQMTGTEMLRIANLNNMEVLVDVNENDIVRVKLGDTANIEVDSYAGADRNFKGIVTEISNTAKQALTQDAVTEFEVKVRILNESYSDLVQADSKLSPFRPGMTASVEVITQRKSNILTVPLAAVTTRDPSGRAPRKADEQAEGENANNAGPNAANDQPAGPAPEMKTVVFVHQNGKVTLREVKTGIADYENIEILSGLKPGEEIVSGPYSLVSKRLKDGDLVTKKADKPQGDQKEAKKEEE